MERVLRAVEQVPRGRVVSYGDIGALVGVGPRLVGRVMSTYGSNVTWWRVTNSSGDLPTDLMEEVRERWALEGILLKTLATQPAERFQSAAELGAALRDFQYTMTISGGDPATRPPDCRRS